MANDELARCFAPVFAFHPDERFLPIDAADYIAAAQVRHNTKKEITMSAAVMTTRKRTRSRIRIVFDDAYDQVFSPLYNNTDHSELQSREDAEIYWAQQHDVTANRRHLKFRRIGGEWKHTGRYDHCKSGETKNLAPTKIAAIRRSIALLVPPELRQRNFLEESVIRAVIRALKEHCDLHGLPRPEWLYVPDGLKNADVLCRFSGWIPDLYMAVQFKSATFKAKGSMHFKGTDGYDVPIICASIDVDRISEILLFREKIDIKEVTIVHDKPSRNPIVQAARHTTIAQVYAFLLNFPVAKMNTRNYWVYDPLQSAPKTWLGLLVQKFVEDLLGEWVVSPLEQNKAVDGYFGNLAVSFKTATPHQKGFQFPLLAAPDHKCVDVFVIGFRAGNIVTSLGVLPVSAVGDWTLPYYCWSSTNPFKGTDGIKTLEQLHAALEKHKR